MKNRSPEMQTRPWWLWPRSFLSVFQFADRVYRTSAGWCHFLSKQEHKLHGQKVKRQGKTTSASASEPANPFLSPLRLTSITSLSGAWHLKSRRWNMKERTPARRWQGFFRCMEGSCGCKVVFDSLMKHHKVIPVSDHTCENTAGKSNAAI